MKQEELNEVLRLHKMWFEGKEGGVMADLSNADLREINLSYVDLSNANISGTTLHYANLNGANLSSAALDDEVKNTLK